MTLLMTFGRGLLAAGKWLFLDGPLKARLAIAGALLSALLIFGVVHYRKEAIASHAAAQTVQDDNRVLTGARSADTRAVLGNSAAKARNLARENTGLAATKAALDANPDWASQPVPPDVLDSLRD